ncbi:MAG: 16S rRNA (cytidine(1402)-2'-O)-methyltransferase [Gemmatimonadales bacterium]
MRRGTLYMLSTPIGHLGDFSFRGLEVLRQVAVVAAEDTRRTRRLLGHYEVSPPLVSLHAHSRPEVVERLLDRVEAGEDVAYVTDAGTPGVSDPGAFVAERAHARGLAVVPIPGPAAVLAALAAAGFPADRFLFLGFLPKKGTTRAALLERIATEPWTTICYEAPGRTVALLQDLEARCGAGRPAAVARELTKLHEEVRRGTVGELIQYYEAHAPRGEVTVVVSGVSGGSPAPAPAPAVPPDAGELISTLRAAGAAPSAIAKELSRRLGLSRHDAYRLLTR